MQFRHAAVVAVEEGQEVLGQIALVVGIECPHDAEVDRDIAARLGATKMLPGCMSA